MTDDTTPTPAGHPCPQCGTAGTLRARHHELTHKTRRKFGLFYVLLSLTIVGFPIALVLWLVAPRKVEVVGVDRWLECSECGAKI